jgi:hypothetical protein
MPPDSCFGQWFSNPASPTRWMYPVALGLGDAALA